MNEPSKYTLKSTPLPPSLPSLPSEYRRDEHGRGMHPQGIDQLVVGPVGDVDEEGEGMGDVGPIPVGEGGGEEGGEGDLKLWVGIE